MPGAHRIAEEAASETPRRVASAPEATARSLAAALGRLWRTALGRGVVSTDAPEERGAFPPEAGGMRNSNDALLPLMYFKGHGVNPLVDADEDALSTFALDSDTGSFELAKLYLLEQGTLPPPESVRLRSG